MFFDIPLDWGPRSPKQDYTGVLNLHIVNNYSTSRSDFGALHEEAYRAANELLPREVLLSVNKKLVVFDDDGELLGIIVCQEGE